MNRTLLVTVCVLWLGLSGCSQSSGPTAPIKRAPIAPQLDMTTEIDRLLGLAKAAEADIASLRRSKWEISDSSSLPSEKNRPGEIDWLQRVIDLRSRELLHYQQRTQDPPERRAAVESFLKQYIQLSVGRLADSKQLVAMGMSLSASGTQDPLVDVYAISIQPFPEQAAELSKHRDKLKSIRDRIPESDRGMIYDIIIKRMLVQIGTMQVEGYEKTPAFEQEQIVRDHVQALIRFMELNSDLQYVHTVWRLSHQYADVLEAPQLADFHRRTVQSVSAHNWYKLNAASIVLLDEGWDARGTGFSSTVTEEGWKTLETKLEQARLLSLLAWQMNPDSSIPTAKLEQLVAAGAKDEWDMRQWFQVSIHAQFDQSDAYSTYLNFLQPNWGGSLRTMALFAGELIKTARIDTRVPEEGLTQLWRLRAKSSYFVMQNPELHEAVSVFVEKTLQAVKGREFIRGDLESWNEFVLTLLLDAQNYRLAKDWYDHCGFSFHEQAMANSGGRLDRAVQIIAACTGPGSEPAIPLVDAIYGLKIPQAAELPGLREKIKSLRDLDPQELTEKLCREMELVIGQYETFESGDWVEFRFALDMPGWKQVTSEKWSFDDEQTIRMESKGSSYLIPVARFHAPYMVETDIQMLDPTGKSPNSAAFLIAGLEWYPQQADEFSTTKVIVYPNLRDTYGIINEDESKSFSFGEAGSRHVRLKVWPNEVECSADGRILAQAAATGERFTQVTIGTPRYFPSYTAFRFHRIRIRKIPYEAVIPVPAEEMAEYGQRVIDFDPTDPDGYLYRSSGLVHQGDLEGAIATLESGLQRPQHTTGIVAQLPELYLLTGRINDAWTASEKAEKQGDTLVTIAVRAMLLACIHDPARRNPQAALELAEKYPGPQLWQVTTALALSHAATGKMDEARSLLDQAKTLKKDKVVLDLLNSFSESIDRGEVPVLQDRPAEK